MKKKILICTLCFTLIFGSLNVRKSYADGGIISLPMLSTVSALAVGTGILLNNSEQIYHIGSMFYDFIDKHNSLTWQTVQGVFASSVALIPSNFVSVKSDFLDICKEFFDTYKSSSSPDFESVHILGYGMSTPWVIDNVSSTTTYKQQGDYVLGYSDTNMSLTYKGVSLTGFYTPNIGSLYKKAQVVSKGGLLYFAYQHMNGNWLYNSISPSKIDYAITSAPSFGDYNWDNVESKKENEIVSLPIPGDLGSFVGQTSDDFWSNSDNLVGQGGLTLPGVDFPSISVDNTISFPNTNVDTNNPSVPDVDDPSIDKPLIPSFPSFGDSLDFSQLELTNVKEKFPFSLPWDLGRLISIFDVDPTPPIFEADILGETLSLDLTQFEELALLIRFFVLIGFILSLIFISTKLLG